jgi:hypothetical protein
VRLYGTDWPMKQGETGCALGMIGAQVKTAPGTLSANCESDSQGLANRYEGAID